MHRQVAAIDAQQVQPPYDIRGLLDRIQTVRARIAAADREEQKQFISALLTRLGAKKNDDGEGRISSTFV